MLFEKIVNIIVDAIIIAIDIAFYIGLPAALVALIVLLIKGIVSGIISVFHDLRYWFVQKYTIYDNNFKLKYKKTFPENNKSSGGIETMGRKTKSYAKVLTSILSGLTFLSKTQQEDSHLFKVEDELLKI
ncbi:hypothetical protein Calow_0801 [Caldicellulosiruptor owensensis OL]|uniref:Uncharacterized protein n=1 Tax=Caldicellulosiruptor owensensis (strain ATCC 700167 / DSM 13100 / OL) TaxID=632518 RepID=E4Q5Z7_CALOW|nr:hypothetical protein [Caldicellulosiruptor owensensis]ADQ04371.1 hypothetical protein Calow_0801 [Caldicellulosiruptor owensensis OL]